MSRVCVTGHRDIPPGKLDFVRRELRKEIGLAVEAGCVFFMSGFAPGVDLEFAAIVAEMKKGNPAFRLEAAIPYRGWLDKKDVLFQKMLEAADEVTVVSEEYASDVFSKRNRFMVERSERVIGVYDGRGKGGTFQTIRLAEKMNRKLRIITVP